MNDDPTNKELMHLIKDLRDRDLKAIDDKVTEIKMQTTKTNGRVSSLEIWRGIMIGGIAVISILVVPLLLNLLKK